MSNHSSVPEPVKGFISYAHDDSKAVEALKSRLDTLVSRGRIKLWYDRMIEAGTKWEPEIANFLESSELVLFCITESFLRSKSCLNEFRQAVEMKKRSLAEIVPVILGKCDWTPVVEISQYQAVPKYGRPIVEFGNVDEAYADVVSTLEVMIDKINRRKALELTDECKAELRSIDPLLAVSGSEHLSMDLEDIYIDPELSPRDDVTGEGKLISGAEVSKLLCGGHSVIVAGEAQSGKSSFCKKTCLELFASGYFPVYVSGKDGYDGSPDKLVDKALSRTYSDAACVSSNKLILLFDDFFKARNPERFLSLLPKNLAVMLVLDEVYDLNMKNAACYKEYASFSLVQMRARKRSELIKRWLSLQAGEGHPPFDNYESYDRLMRQVELALGRMFGKGLIPAYPFYILSILITTEVAVKPLNQDVTTQGYCYQALLYAVLWRVGVRNQHMDIYVNYLTELAYMLFKKGAGYKCAEEDLAQFNKEYGNRFNLPIPAAKILEKLEKGLIFGKDSLGYYDFRYPYLKYYFIAKFLAENFETKESDFRHVFENLGNSANAYTAVFIAHHDRSVRYLNNLEESANSLFSGVEPCYLKDNDMRQFDERSKMIVQAALPDQNVDPDKERERFLAVKECHEEATQRPMSGGAEDDADPEIRDFVIAMRLCQVMGLILKSRPGSILIDAQKKLIRSIVDVYARIIRVFFDTFKDEASQAAIIEYLSYKMTKGRKDVNATGNEKLRSVAAKAFWNLNFVTTHNLIIHCVGAIGSDELIRSIRIACEERTDEPLLAIIPYIVEIIFKKRVDVAGLKKLLPSLPFTVKSMVRLVVARFCMFHHVEYTCRQQLETLFDLRNTLPSYIGSRNRQ